jgi:D-sedoheptulose 7-phosphate isomerase
MAVNTLIKKYPVLKPLEADILKACGILISSFSLKHKLLLCGNGGSAADCEHISGELLKSFQKKRSVNKRLRNTLRKKFKKEGNYLASNLQEGFPAIPLPSFSSLLTAFSNDVSPDLAFAQLVHALGNKGDVLLCISTTGNSKNILFAAQVAKTKRLTTIALTGMGGGKLKGLSDVTIDVPGNTTPSVQEYHVPVYHAICTEVERHLVKAFQL